MIDLLKKSRIFEGLEESVLKKIAGFSKLETHKSEVTLITEDSDDNYDLFILVKGRVKIFVSSKFFGDDAETKKEVYTVAQGENFGEMSSVVKKRRSASAVTVSESEVIRIDGKKFSSFISKDRDSGFEILKRICESLYDRIENSNFMLRNFLI